MLSTMLIIGFIGVSLLSCITLLATCIVSSRAAPRHTKVAARRPSSTLNYSTIIDIQWRRLDPQLVA